MLIRLHPTANGRPRNPGAEYFARVDGDGAVELIDGDEAPASAGPGAMQATTLFTGGDFGDRGGPWLFMVGLWTPEDFREEFIAWYKNEHLPILLECREWDGCRFVETKTANGCQFHSLHQLSDRAALDSEQRKRSRATPWFKRLSKNDWFDGAFTRTLYKRPA